jgi:hypothetical protein
MAFGLCSLMPRFRGLGSPGSDASEREREPTERYAGLGRDGGVERLRG